MFRLICSVFLIFQCFGAKAEVTLQPEVNVVSASKKINYIFNLHESSIKLMDVDLVETHTKLLHMIVYDKSLTQFNHVHPEFDGNSWKVSLDLPVSGTYFVWVQGESKSGGEFANVEMLKVENGQAELPSVALGDVRTGVDGVTRVQLDDVQINAGSMTMIDFTISRTDGSNSLLSPYLGAFAHVIATPASGDALIHVHPMQGSKPNSGMLHATFPSPGEYRLWIQFNDNNELKTIPLSIIVK